MKNRVQLIGHGLAYFVNKTTVLYHLGLFALGDRVLSFYLES